MFMHAMYMHSHTNIKYTDCIGQMCVYKHRMQSRIAYVQCACLYIICIYLYSTLTKNGWTVAQDFDHHAKLVSTCECVFVCMDRVCFEEHRRWRPGSEVKRKKMNNMSNNVAFEMRMTCICSYKYTYVCAPYMHPVNFHSEICRFYYIAVQ